MNSNLYMPAETLHVLVVEDNPGDVRLVREMLTSTPSRSRFVLETQESLSAGLQRLLQGGIDVVLLDLSLPDSQGPETLTRILEAAPELPVVVLTGLEDETLGLQLVENGAQDHLSKQDLNERLLVRALVYAVERQVRQSRQERELHDLEDYAAARPTPVTARRYGIEPLVMREQPQQQVILATDYGVLLDLALEHQTHGDRGEALKSGQQALAERLGQLAADPRDLVELHTQVLRKRIRGASGAKQEALMQEGRLLLLAMMGYLLGFYRSRCLVRDFAVPQPSVPSRKVRSPSLNGPERGNNHE